MSANTFILFCNCSYSQIIDEQRKGRVLRAVADSNIEFAAVDDLCRLAADKDKRLYEWAKMEGLTIIACYPRAVRWLFQAAGAELGREDTSIFNMRTQSAEDIIGLLTATEAKGAKVCGDPEKDIQKQGDWVPWFPVIDHDLCENCKQCMNFCLFGVYGVDDEGQVCVKKPTGCKTNCPACARICPAGAIMFPKYDKSPINGDRVDAENISDEQVKVNLAEVLSGDIHKFIRQRGTSRTDDGAKARIERLKKFQKELDIPQDVLKELSLDEAPKDNKGRSNE